MTTVSNISHSVSYSYNHVVYKIALFFSQLVTSERITVHTVCLKM